jgi:hypothetical protein
MSMPRTTNEQWLPVPGAKRRPTKAAKQVLDLLPPDMRDWAAPALDRFRSLPGADTTFAGLVNELLALAKGEEAYARRDHQEALRRCSEVLAVKRRKAL